MFLPNSRYFALENVVNTDAEGQQVASKALRLTPRRTGIFLHSIEEQDRLDHLAYQYYKKSKSWWQICDANAEGAFPQALLGKDPEQTTYFPLAIDESIASLDWATLLSTLRAQVGVASVLLKKTEISELARIEENEGAEFVVKVPRFATGLLVGYNTLNVKAETLLSLIIDLGFEVLSPKPIGRIGKQIVIPRLKVGS